MLYLLQPMTLLVLIPLVGALLAFLIRPARRYIAIAAALGTGYFALRIFLDGLSGTGTSPIHLPEVFGIANRLQADGLSGVILLLVSGFALLIFLYSFRFRGGPRDDWKFFTFALLTYGAANGALLASSVLVLYFFWGVLLFTVYGLLFYGRGDVEMAARKMFVLNGVADFLLLFGLLVFIIYTKQQGVEPGQLAYFPGVRAERFALTDPLAIVAFVCIAAAALTKAGAFPMHTWIPKAAESVPAETMAFIPASLDKLLGIYLFVRLCYSIFDIRSNLTVQLIFLSIGAVTILAMVFMAIVQKDVMRSLAYLTVSQVGYMILGIASGTIIGIAGGLFHMVNGIFYKGSFFLASGAVKRQTGESDLGKLGGLARAMPVTFFSFLIAALAISGVPPLNGFVSKWLVYQSFVELGRTQPFFLVFLVVGAFGSVLTLASFLKLTHSLFLGRRPKQLEGVKEVSFTGWFPPLLMALTCIAFGVFAFRLPLRYLISPALSASVIVPVGHFSPLAFAAIMLIILSLGFLIYVVGGSYKPRPRKVFLGAEELTEEEMHLSGPHFYSSIKEIKIFREFYRFAEGGSFDPFHYIEGVAGVIGKTLKRLIDDALNAFVRFVRYFSNLAGKGFSLLHTGGLSFYLGWILLGILILILFLIRGGGGV